MSFDPIEYAQNQLVPFLAALVQSAEEEGSADQAQFFGRILRGMQMAREPVDLAEPFMELSTSAFLGFDFSPSVALLLDQVLMYAGQLSEVLSLDDDEIQ